MCHLSPQFLPQLEEPQLVLHPNSHNKAKPSLISKTIFSEEFFGPYLSPGKEGL